VVVPDLHGNVAPEGFVVQVDVQGLAAKQSDGPQEGSPSPAVVNL